MKFLIYGAGAVGQYMAGLLGQAGFASISTHSDLAGQPRVTEGQLPP